VSEQALRAPRGRERAAGFGGGIQARLRSAFLARGWLTEPEPRVRFGVPLLPGLSALAPDHAAAAADFLAQAEAARAGAFVFEGVERRFDERIDWRPRGASDGWLAAHHRLDGAFAVGIAATLARDGGERRAWYEAGLRLVADWITRSRTHPSLALEVPSMAPRISNLIGFYLCFAAELRNDVRARRLILDSIYRQTATLAAALPRLAPDAWLVAVGRTLFVAGRFFDGLEARSWVELGTVTLWTQLREQVNDDGGHRSRSPVWQAFVLGEFLAVLAVLRAANDDLPPWARKRVKGMADFLARLMHPDGALPSFDGDVLRGMRPADELLATAAVVLHEPALALHPALPGIWPLLLLGRSGERVYSGFAGGARPRLPRALRRTGYYVLPGATGDVMILDGDTSERRVPFDFELSVGGPRLVVGSGVTQGARDELAALAGSGRARNVLVVRRPDGPALAWTPVVSEARFGMRDGLVYYLGSARAGDVVHRRSVVSRTGSFWIVCDEVLGDGEVVAESFLHFHPETRMRAACGGRPSFVAERGDDARIRLVFDGVGQVGLSMGLGGATPQGWYGAAPGETHPAPVISVGATGPAPLAFGYAMLPRHDGAATLAFERDPFHLRIRLAYEEGELDVTVADGEVELVTRGLPPPPGW
jgi:hypothetical protein